MHVVFYKAQALFSLESYIFIFLPSFGVLDCSQSEMLHNRNLCSKSCDGLPNISPQALETISDFHNLTLSVLFMINSVHNSLLIFWSVNFYQMLTCWRWMNYVGWCVINSYLKKTCAFHWMTNIKILVHIFWNEVLSIKNRSIIQDVKR